MDKSSRFLKTAWLVVAMLAVALRLSYLYFHPAGYDQNVIYAADGHDYDQLAKSLMRGEGLAWEGHLTSVIPPTYPFFIRACYGIFGVNVVAVRLVQIMLSVLTCVLLWGWGRRLLGRCGGLIVFAASAFYYPFIQMPCYVMTETLFVFLLALILFLTSCVDGRRNHVIVIAMGLTTGIALLARPVALAIVAVLLVFLWRHGGEARKGSALMFLLAVLLVWMPWPVRNYAVHDTFVPFSTNGGLNLYRGNNINATGGTGGWTRQGPDTGPLPKTGHMSEVEADRHLKGLAADFIRRHPGTYFKLCAKRTINLWRPYYDNTRSMGKLLMLVSDVWLYPLALLGILVAYKGRTRMKREQAWVLVSLFLLFNLLYVSAITVIRYRYPIMPMVMFFAAIGIMDVIQRIAVSRSVQTGSR